LNSFGSGYDGYSTSDYSHIGSIGGYNEGSFGGTYNIYDSYGNDYDFFDD